MSIYIFYQEYDLEVEDFLIENKLIRNVVAEMVDSCWKQLSWEC